jgi:hypothetical protein
MNFSLKGNFESRRGNKCVITQHYMVHTILSEMFKRNRIHVSGQEAIVTKCAVRQANNMIFFFFWLCKNFRISKCVDFAKFRNVG